MATSQQNEFSILIERIQNCLQKYEVWQLLRLLKLNITQVNHAQELIRFRTDSHLRFPQNNVSAIEYSEISKKITLIINFMSLLGGSGILPLHYTELLVKQQRFNNYDLIDLIDTLQQQSIWYYCQAFEQSRIYLFHENYQLGISKNNPVNDFIRSIGATTVIHEKDQKIINTFLPHFANRIKSVNGLQLIISRCMRLPIEIQEFTKYEVNLPLHEATTLTGNIDSNNRLSHSFTLGTKIRLDVFHFTIIVRLQPFHRIQYTKYKKVWCELISQLVQWYLANVFHYQIKFVFTNRFENTLGQNLYLDSA